MPQSLTQLYVHLVFSTKNREPWITPELRPQTHQYIGGVCKRLESQPLQVGGVSDHVHVLALLSKKLAPTEFVKEVKSRSSRWVKDQLGNNRNQFAWQAGYGLFSVSPGHVDVLREYIQNQDTHHRNETYQDELRRLFKKYEVTFDEKYVWD